MRLPTDIPAPMTYHPGDGTTYIEYIPLSGKDAHAARWRRATRRAIRPGWRVRGLVLSGMAPICTALVIGPHGYWFTL